MQKRNDEMTLHAFIITLNNVVGLFKIIFTFFFKQKYIVGGDVRISNYKSHYSVSKSILELLDCGKKRAKILIG